MLRFLAIYAGIYAALLLYVYTLLARAFELHARAAAAFIVLAVALIAAPIAGRMLEREDAFQAARVVSLAGYFGMTIVFWLVTAGFVVDAWNLVMSALAVSWRTISTYVIPMRGAVVGFFIALIPLLAWSLREAAALRLEIVHLQSAKLPAGTKPVRVLQLSDLHLGLSMREAAVQRVLTRIREARPDLLLVTGDLLDSNSTSVNALVAQFRGVDPPCGKFAVLGNHEFYPGVERSVHLLESGGFRVLRQEHVTVRCREIDVVVAGVDYDASRETNEPGRADEQRALRGASPGAYTILLKHQPLVARGSVGHFDLQLSGHTHGGQVFPFHFFVRHFYPRMTGYHQISADSALYISRGAGAWGPPLRLLAPPDITLFLIGPE